MVLGYWLSREGDPPPDDLSMTSRFDGLIGDTPYETAIAVACGPAL